MNAITPKSPIFSLPPGSQIIIDKPTKSVIYLVLVQERQKVKVRDQVSGEPDEINKQTLYDGWKAGQVTFLPAYHQIEAFSADTRAKSAAAFAALSENVKRAALVRQEIMNHLQHVHDQDGVIKNSVLQLISDRAEREHPGIEGLSRSALREYWRDWNQSGGDIMSLTAVRGKKRRFVPRLDKEVIAQFEAVINEHYLHGSRPAQLECHEVLVQRIRELNRARGPEDQLHAPALRTFRRWVGKLNKYEVAKARFGENYARKHFGAAGPGEIASRPLQIVQADHTPIDLALVSEELGLPCSRAWLTVLIDVYTRCIIGFHISFDPPSFVSIARALENAILPKDKLLALHPNVRNHWPCFGVPERLVLDNAPEFHAEDFKYNCALLGIRLEYVEARKPHLKGIVERVQWTINRFFQSMPSTTFSNALEKGDFDPTKFTFVTLSELKSGLLRLIVDVYHQRFHRGINAVPHKRWDEGIVDSPPRLPKNIGDLRIILGQSDTRKLHDYGIDFRNIRYFSYEIQEIRSHPGHNANGLVEIRYNGDDASRIDVQHPDGHYIELKAVNFDELEGVSFFQFNFLRKKAMDKAKGAVNMEQILEAKDDVRRTLGFYDKGRRKRKRRYSRAETRMVSAYQHREPNSDLHLPGQPPKSADKPESDSMDHRKSTGGWGSQSRRKV